MPRAESRISRRQFHQTAVASAAGLFAAPALLRGRNLNERLNIAAIGVGGRGAANLAEVASQNIVALCDVNESALDAAAMKHPQARREVDFRKLFDRPDDFDAVVVSTCEHTHAFATMLALKHGKHVYCEKPLTHSIWEARQIRLAAAETPVATQMGIQIHATENFRRVVELFQAQVIGPVREAHVWVSRAWGRQPLEQAGQDIVQMRERPTETAEVPAGLDWDLWLGPAPARPFHPVYVPGPKWYRWWDFGSGTMSDLGSHMNDLPFWALQLQAPLTIEAAGPPPHPELAPATMSATYQYPSRGELPPVQLSWYQGQMKPTLWSDKKIPQWDSGILFVGDKGMLLADYDRYVLLPEQEFADAKLPEPTLARSPGHHAEWIECCKSGATCSANFEYSGWLTEANHLGNVAYRLGQTIEWNPDTLTATNAPEADAIIRREYRPGWSL